MVSNTITIARITRERGVRGEFKAFPLSRIFNLLAPENSVILMTPSGDREERVIKTMRNNARHWIVSFYGIDSIDQAQKYRNSLLLASRELLPPLPPGEYFVDDIIGLSVVTSGGDFIGKVEDVLETGSNDVYVVNNGDKELMIPAIKDVVKKIDLAEKTIVIDLMTGLFD